MALVVFSGGVVVAEHTTFEATFDSNGPSSSRAFFCLQSRVGFYHFQHVEVR
jgi:hypothetical protein